MSDKKFEFTQEERRDLHEILWDLPYDFNAKDETINQIETLISKRWVSDEEIHAMYPSTYAQDESKKNVDSYFANFLHKHGMFEMRNRIFKTDAK